MSALKLHIKAFVDLAMSCTLASNTSSLSFRAEIVEVEDIDTQKPTAKPQSKEDHSVKEKKKDKKLKKEKKSKRPKR